MKRKFLCLLLALTLVLGLAATVSADEEFITSGDWTYTYVEGEMRIVSYNGTDTHVTVPAEIDGQKVHALGYGMGSPFLDIQDTLTAVTIEPGIQDLETHAFRDCTALTEVHIPDTIVNIADGVFRNCTALESIEIPGSVRVINHYAFYESTALKEVILHEGLGVIGDFAFANTGLTSITIPASVYWIQDYAIGYCGDPDILLQSVEGFSIYGYTCSEATRYARDTNFITFYDLTNLTDVSGMCGDSAAWYFEESTGTLYITGEDGTEHYHNGLAPWVHHANRITRVVVGEGINHLGMNTFANHYPNLCEVSLPSTLIGIENRCFEGCTSLSQITIPEKTSFIGGNVFYNTGLNWIVLPNAKDFYGSSMNNKSLGDCSHLSNVVFLGDAWELDNNVFTGDTLTAWYPEGNPTWTASVMQNYGGSVTWKPYDGLDFTDVLPFQFWYEPVSWAMENGITTGTTETAFNPNGQCQRGQIVTFLWRAAGCPVVEAENPFTDVKETDFYYDAVLWAVENGITTGTSGTTFSPFKTCTRAEVVTFLWRAAGEPASSAANPFADVAETDFFHTAVLWAVENGITNGLSSDSFGPYAICNRAPSV